MSLLEEIQAAAVNPETDLSTLLRKCKVLAARLRSQPLEDWLVWESDGYPPEAEVPEYRIWPLQIKAHFRSYFGGLVHNFNVPPALIPKAIRPAIEKYKCRQSIASIETLTKRVPTGETTQVNIPNLSLQLNNILRDHECVQAWGESSVVNLVELLNIVRNRILDFSLKVEKVAPTAGNSSSPSTRTIDPATATQIFNMTIYGPANVVGSANDSTITINVVTKDFASLERLLRENGVEDGDIKDLEVAIQSDPAPVEPSKFGPKVGEWIGRMIQKAATGGWDIAIEAAGTMLATAIAKYYGLQ